MLTHGLMAALDRTKTTLRNATYVLAETASSLGHDANSLKFYLANKNKMSDNIISKPKI